MFSKLRLKKRGGSLRAAEVKLRESLRHSRRELIAASSELEAGVPDIEKDAMMFAAYGTTNDMTVHAATVSESLERLITQKVKAQTACRRFQVENGIKRDVTYPSRFRTAMTLQLGFLAEGMLGGALFVADGAMDIAESMATGFAVSGINTITACAMGFFLGRYMGYKIDALRKSWRDYFIRTIAWLGFATSSVGLLILHFGAARVRVTGSHGDIFTFDEVSFSVTFNDYFALALMTIGLVGAVIAFYKGRHGISDPIVGYMEVSQAADTHIYSAAEMLYESAMDRLDDAYDTARDMLEEHAEQAGEIVNSYNQSLRELNDSIVQHNNMLDASIDDLVSMQEADCLAQSYIEQEVQTPHTIDFDALYTLRLEQLAAADIPSAIQHHQEKTALLSELHAAQQRASAVIEEAYNTFLNSAVHYSLNDIKENYHEKE